MVGSFTYHDSQRPRPEVPNNCRVATATSQIISGATKGEGQRGGVAPGRSSQGGAKEPDQKYFMTNDHKSEFDIVL